VVGEGAQQTDVALGVVGHALQVAHRIRKARQLLEAGEMIAVAAAGLASRTSRLRSAEWLRALIESAPAVRPPRAVGPGRRDRSGCPVATLGPRVAPNIYERDGFVVTLWTYYEPATAGEVSPADYATALKRLHAGMRKFIREPRQLREAGEQLIPVASIVGSVDGASQLSTGPSGPSVIELAPAWATYWSPCARASHSRPSRCGHGAASTTFSTAIIGSQQPGP
jgi:hypothetical protein